jgi:hypothetical protein
MLTMAIILEAPDSYLKDRMIFQQCGQPQKVKNGEGVFLANGTTNGFFCRIGQI